jgi:hypothetical protein
MQGARIARPKYQPVSVYADPDMRLKTISVDMKIVRAWATLVPDS